MVTECQEALEGNAGGLPSKMSNLAYSANFHCLGDRANECPSGYAKRYSVRSSVNCGSYCAWT